MGAMAAQPDSSKVQGKGNGSGVWGWKKSMKQTLLMTFSVMTVGLVFALIWESSGPLSFYHGTPWPDSEKTVRRRVELVGGDKLLEVDPRAAMRELEADSSVSTPASSPNSNSLKAQNNDRPRLPSLNVSRSAGQEVWEPHISTRVSEESESANQQARVRGTDLELEAADDSKLEHPGRQDVAEVKPEVCDYSQGQWVKDEKRNLYSGKSCKAYLSAGFACREMNRPNFEYEKFRWQPDGCDLPAFSSDGFLQRLRNKVLAFVGDSLGRQQFQSLMCMITEGKDDKTVEDVSKRWHDVRWAYRFRPTNTTILFHWSASLCQIQGNHPDEQPGYSAMHLDKPAIFLSEYLHKLDVIVLNTGHHWNRGKLQINKWHPYVDGKPIMGGKLAGIAEALNLTVFKVIEWLDRQLEDDLSKGKTKHQPAVYMRTLSPRHFKNGDWNTGGGCDSTQYVPNVSEAQPVQQPPKRAYRGPITELVAENAVKGTRVTLLNITGLSKFREESHISKYGVGKDSTHQDCLHWCLPGVPDVWNELLYGSLLADTRLDSGS